MASGLFGTADYKQSEAKSTGRQGSETQYPRQFILDQNKTLGGPFTVNDLFNLSTHPHSLFGFGAQQQQRPEGGFNLGFGAPTAATSATLGTGSLASGPPLDITGQTYSMENTPTTSPGPRHTLSEIAQAYSNDPDKMADLQRFFQQGHLDPNGFTTEQFRVELGRAKQYGLSGRSTGDLTDVLAYLQRNEQTGAAFGGGKGSGVF